MIKKMYIRIVTFFFLMGILITGTLAYININDLNSIKNITINQNKDQNFSQDFESDISNKTNRTKRYIAYFVVTYSVICGTILYIEYKNTGKIMSDVFSEFGKEYNSPNLKKQYLIQKNSNKAENELTSALKAITTEINEKLRNIEEEKRQIENILLHMSDGVIAFNLAGKIIYINPAATNLLNLKQDDDDFEKIFRKINIDTNLEKLIYLDELTSFEQKININDKYFTVSFKPFKDSKEKNAGVIVLIQDITEHVKLDNMRKEFVADVSHELKTPITSIMGYADTLLEGEYDKDVEHKFLNVIATEARRMARLVTDLLTLSKHDSNKSSDEKQEFDLGELVKKCQEKLQIEIKKKHHNVECFVTANVPPVTADKYGIERVILNILSNSIKYTEENGTIKIYVGFVYNDAYIKIIDNGIGIPEEDLSRIFERFYRVDKARSRQLGGTGLGLSIAKEILDRNNGSIDIKSEVRKGYRSGYKVTC